MDNNTSPTNDEKLYLVWYEQGSYTERRFLIKGEENARKEVERLNEHYHSKNPHMMEEGEEEGDYDTFEYWTYEMIDFHNPY